MSQPSAFEGALVRLGRDVTLLHELAVIYLEDYPALVQSLRQAALEGRSDDVARAAHSLRGLAATFDCHSLVKQTLAVENAAREGRVAGTISEHASIAGACEQLAHDLRQLLAHRGPDVPSPQESTSHIRN